MRKIFLFLIGVIAACSTAMSMAQTLPSGPITMIVPFPAGGGTDAFARALADHLRVALDRPVVINNIGGGGGAIGLFKLARSKPDGLTIGIGSTAGIVNVPVLKPKATPYEPLKDFAPIGQFTGVSHIFAVNKQKLPSIDSIAKLVDYLKKHPGEVSYGTPGIGTGQHIAAELFQQMTGTKMLHVPYSGSSQVVSDLLGGQIDLAIDTGAILLPQIKTGKLQPLGWTGKTRPDFDKNLPMVSESVPGYERVGWHGLFAPAGTPQKIIDLYAKELHSFAVKPETAAAFKELGVQVVYSTPEQFREEIKRELDRIAKVVASSDSKFE